LLLYTKCKALDTQGWIDFTQAAVYLHKRDNVCASTRGVSDAASRLQNDGWTIYAASLVCKAVAGLFGVDACETTRHGQWLSTTSSEWRGKLRRPATRAAAAKTKLHAPPHDSAAMDWQPERVLAAVKLWR